MNALLFRFLDLARSSSSYVGRTQSSWVLSVFVVSCLVASCAEPGRLYVVAPEISGVVLGAAALGEDIEMRLIVMHRDNPILYDRQKIELDESEHFDFDPTRLAVAGHEYSTIYRVFLHLKAGSVDRVIWRSNLSRRSLAGSIELDCDLDRPTQHGQPCWVVNPLQHPWLVEQGAQNFRRLCAECHGSDGRGGLSAAPDSRVNASDLTKLAARHDGRFDRAAIAEWIEGRSLPKAHGTRVMPVWGERLSVKFDRYPQADELIGATLDPILVYLESIQEQD